MTWLVWALFVLAAAALVWWFRRTQWRADQKPDSMEGHYAARRRERAAALTEWERDFRRAQGLPEPVPATTMLGRGEAVVPVSRMLTTANRLMWPPTRAELNPVRDVECAIADVPLSSAPHAAPTVSRPPAPAKARPTLYCPEEPAR